MPNQQGYSAKVNEQFNFSPEDIESIDLVKETEGHFHIVSNNKAFRAELMDYNLAEKRFRFRIEGEIFEVKLADHYDRMVEKMGLNANTQTAAKDVKAPMPGLVLEVMVEAGQSVKEGETLLILEAMKMENVIKAPADATIAKVEAQKGQAVEKGSLLVSFAS